MNNPADYCHTENPTLATSCYVYGTGIAADVSLVNFPYLSSGRFDGGSNGGPFSGQMSGYSSSSPTLVGSVWGLSYKKTSKQIFSAALMKRHAAFGTGSTGGIYATNVETDATTLFATVPNTGTDPHNTANYNTDIVNVNGNPFDAVGKIGLGDMDISEDEQTLYVVNLNDKKIYPINSTTGVVGSPITTPNPDCIGGERRPFGLAIRDNKLYLGQVCDAGQTTDTTAVPNLNASVWQLDLATNTWLPNPLLIVPLNYKKGISYNGGYNPARGWWQGWTDAWTADPTSLRAVNGANTYATHQMSNGRKVDITAGYFIQFPQPILSDIEFDADGNMILGFMDRMAHQIGTSPDMNGLKPPGTSAFDFFYTTSGGDILKAAAQANGSAFVLENNAQSGSQNGANPNNFQGPNGGEFYDDKRVPNVGIIEELSFGALTVNLLKNELISSVVDVIGVDANGFVWFNNTNGQQVRQYEPLNSLSTFDKASGLGELVTLCNPMPIQVGNYVWNDTDKDGVQDPCETPLSNVTVSLWKGGTQIASTTTNANGEYYFSSKYILGAAWTGTGADTTLLANTAYEIRIDTTNQTRLDTIKLTTANATANNGNDLNDSDASVTGNYAVIAFTTGAAGSTNHTYDFGFAPTCDTTLIVSNTTICNGTAVNLFSLASGVKGTLTYSTNGTTWTALANPTNVDPSVSTTYFVKDTLVSGCFDIDTLTITVNQLATITSVHADAATCVNGVIGSNAAVAVRGIVGMASYAYRTNGTTGLFALNATASTLDSIRVGGLANPSSATTYTFRIWGLDTTCFNDTTVVLNPAVCPPCSITATFTQGTCNNNGTNAITTDDYFTVTVSGVTSTNGGTSGKYEVMLNGTVLNAGGTAYGTPIIVGGILDFKSDGATTYNLTVRDVDIQSCTTTVFTTAASAACSTVGCKPVICLSVTITKFQN